MIKLLNHSVSSSQIQREVLLDAEVKTENKVSGSFCLKGVEGLNVLALTLPQLINMPSRIIDPMKSPTAAHPIGKNRLATFPPRFSSMESVRL